MANAANKLFNLMKKSGTDTVSEVVGLTVISTSPLKLSNGDNLILTDDFLIFNQHIDKTKISIGDKFLAITTGKNQFYYVNEIVYSANVIDKYLQEINNLKTRVTTTEDKITELENKVTSLDGRVTALEARI